MECDESVVAESKLAATDSPQSTLERHMPGPVIIFDYDPLWPVIYEEEKRLIISAIGAQVLAIEHVGSTSVPGLAAKPIIDIMVGVRSLDDVQHCLAPLAAIGYVFKADAGIPGRRFFNKGPQTEHRHLHMAAVDGQFWRDQLLFRDYLRAHPDTAAAYATLKRELATRFGDDREGYTEAKTEFVLTVLEQARS